MTLESIKTLETFNLQPQNLIQMVVNKKNPFAHKAKASAKKKATGKRVGKSKPEKANNQRNRIIK